MSDITSAKKNIQIEGARYGSAVSESLIQTLGASINYLNGFIDTTLTGIQTNITNIHSNIVTKFVRSGGSEFNGQGSGSVSLGSGDIILCGGGSNLIASLTSAGSGSGIGGNSGMFLAMGPATFTVGTNNGAGMGGVFYIILNASSISI